MRPPGSQRSVSTPGNVERVRQAMLSSPFRSARRHAIGLELNDQTVSRIVHNDLGLHNYKIAIVQKLNVINYALRAAYAEYMFAIFAVNDNAIVIMSDKAHFHLNEQPLHRSNITVRLVRLGMR